MKKPQERNRQIVGFSKLVTCTDCPMLVNLYYSRSGFGRGIKQFGLGVGKFSLFLGLVIVRREGGE